MSTGKSISKLYNQCSPESLSFSLEESSKEPDSLSHPPKPPQAKFQGGGSPALGGPHKENLQCLGDNSSDYKRQANKEYGHRDLLTQKLSD